MTPVASRTSDAAFTGPGQRETRQRAVIREWLSTSSAFVSAQQVLVGIAAKGDAVGLSTVYRTLQALSDAGEYVLRTDSGEALYRRCHTGHHHHHLTCRGCGLTIEL